MYTNDGDFLIQPEDLQSQTGRLPRHGGYDDVHTGGETGAPSKLILEIHCSHNGRGGSDRSIGGDDGNGDCRLVNGV